MNHSIDRIPPRRISPLLWTMVVLVIIGSGWSQVKCHRARLAIQSLDARIADMSNQDSQQIRSKALASSVKHNKLSELIRIALTESDSPLQPNDEFVMVFNRASMSNDCTWFTVPTGQFELTLKVEDTLLQETWEFVYPLQSRTACKLRLYFDVTEPGDEPLLKIQLDRENERPVRETLPVIGFVPVGSLRPLTRQGNLSLHEIANESSFCKQSKVQITFGGWQRSHSLGTDNQAQTQAHFTVRFTAVISAAN
jgi:hypothetical protein